MRSTTSSFCVAKPRGRRSLLDGLRRVEGVLQSILEEEVWEDMESRFAYWPLGLRERPFEELRARFERMKQIGWNFDHCHNVAEVFRHRITTELQDSRLEPFCRIIDAAYDSSHNCQWTLIGLADGRRLVQAPVRMRGSGLLYACTVDNCPAPQK